MNKRQRKKKYKKEYHVGIDFSNTPDITMCVPITLLETVFKNPINIDVVQFLSAIEHNTIHGRGFKVPIGMVNTKTGELKEDYIDKK